MSAKTVGDNASTSTSTSTSISISLANPGAAHFMDDHNSANAPYLDTVGHIRDRLQTLNAALSQTLVGAGSCSDSCTDDMSGNSHDHPPPVTHDTSADAALHDPQMSRGDKAILSRGQAALANSFAFRASTHAFGQHWETMTRTQRHKHLEDYLQSKYDDHPHKTDIRSFLVEEILCKARGDKHVSWNGYFVESITELALPPVLEVPSTQQETDSNTHSTGTPDVNLRSSKPVTIRFAKPTTRRKGGASVPTAHTALQDAPLVTHVGTSAVSNGAGARALAQTRTTRVTSSKHSAVISKKAALATSHPFGGMLNRLKRERQAFYVSDNDAFD